jgi:carbonic anhydrase/acetyltransferase-like protein (isoleucine patch superfamily)
LVKKYKDYYPKIDKTAYISDSSVVIGRVKIGKNSSVWDCTVLRGDIDEIIIGDNSNVQDGSILHVNEGIPLHIGNGVTIGHGVKLHGCKIGDNSLVAIGAIVLNGAVIGKNCIIGAGAVVTQNAFIPDNSMVFGIPGKVIRELKQEEIESNRENSKSYCELAKNYIE